MTDDHQLTNTHRAYFAVQPELRRGRLTLRLLDGPRGPQDFRLTKATIQVGRSPHADVVIEDRSISKIHFDLHLTPQGVELRDRDSTNGCWVHGVQVVRARLRPGDAFRAGDRSFVIMDIGDVEVVATVATRCGSLQGSSVVMRELFATIDKLSLTPLDILILGETGTGKELTAQTIHQLSARRNKPFITLDCGAISSSLADATLFGFRKGAFTGADRDQPGVFEEANGGTIFLDEIGELLPELQVKLLRVLERRELTRLGEPARNRAIDVRVVAATHRDLRREVAEGRFREDLFYRLARGMLTTPPLRERSEDIVALAETFLLRLRDEYEIQVWLSPAAKDALLRHTWPGNVRELRNSIEQAAFIKRSGELGPTDLRLGSLTSQGLAMAEVADICKGYERAHMALDRQLLPKVLDESKGSLSEAARRLGISRDRLRSKLRALQLYPRDGDQS
ncbi:MAG: sigma 54-interacting transcriptional regulator [Deltaproteobacteria bacterium]|nr:sigma 54-interacting transcriptional regulator [Deltaproteobacteria bacterium]